MCVVGDSAFVVNHFRLISDSILQTLTKERLTGQLLNEIKRIILRFGKEGLEYDEIIYRIGEQVYAESSQKAMVLEVGLFAYTLLEEMREWETEDNTFAANQLLEYC